MTEPAPPSGGEPSRSGQDPVESAAVESAPAADRPSPWAGPFAGVDEGPSAPPEVAAVGYAPPPVPPSAPSAGQQPPSGTYPGGWPPPGSAPGQQPWSAPPGGSSYGPVPGHPQPSTGWSGGPADPAAAPGFPGAAPLPGAGWGPRPPAVGPRPGPLPPPPREPARPPKRIDPVPGTPFGVVHLDVPPVTSGLAVGSLVTGIAAILVSLLVLCFGIAGPDYGGAWAAGAFTVLGALAGTAAIVAGLLARRQIRRPAPPPAVRFTGNGLAVAGVSCGGVGLLLSLLGLGLALVVQLA